MIRARTRGGATAGGDGSVARRVLAERAVVVIPALVLVLVLAAAPVAGHAINAATVDPQVTPDGTVYIETAFLETDGWVALLDPTGAFVGHARVERGSRVVTDVAIPVADDAWPDGGALRVQPVTYAEDGDGRFDPDADRELVQFGGTPDPVAVARGDAPARVLAAGADPLAVADGRVTVRRVALPAAGHVVVRNATTGGDGRVLGSRALEAGTHRNVTVEFADPPARETRVAIALHRDDGDGTFEADADPAVRVGNATVETRLAVAPPGASDDPGVVTATPAGDEGSSGRTGAVLAAAVVTGLLGIAVGVAGIAGARRGWW